MQANHPRCRLPLGSKPGLNLFRAAGDLLQSAKEVILGGRPLAFERHQGIASAGLPDDMRLMARIRERDLHAFEELYRSYHPRLSRFLANLAHRPQIVEEVLNDTMMAVWDKPDSFRGESRLSTWIFAIAYRKAMKALRRLDEAVEDKNAENRVSAEAGPDEMQRRKQVQALLLAAIARLSADHRAVVDLTYFHGMSCREIAEIMQCPVNTVKTRMFHARRQLRLTLAGTPSDWF